MSKTSLPEYEQHPVAIQLMPGGMNDEEFTAFCEDVGERGIIYPISLFEGKVLDGWHRYRAAHKTGTNFKTIEYNGKDPAGYVAACNVMRRKLGSLQRALVGAKIHRDHNVTQREVCKRFGISNEVLTLVLRAIDSRNTRLLKKIESDSDFTRGMLREELEEIGVVSPKAPKEPEHVERTAASPFPGVASAPGKVHLSAAGAFTGLGGNASGDADSGDDDSDLGDAEDDVDLIGDDKPLPTVGKRNSHPERRPKASAAQVLSDAYKALMHDEKVTFLQMVWPELRPVAEEMGLPGLGKSKKASAKDQQAEHLAQMSSKATKLKVVGGA